jgi:hypothetical protein
MEDAGVLPFAASVAGAAEQAGAVSRRISGTTAHVWLARMMEDRFMKVTFVVMLKICRSNNHHGPLTRTLRRRIPSWSDSFERCKSISETGK